MSTAHLLAAIVLLPLGAAVLLALGQGLLVRRVAQLQARIGGLLLAASLALSVLAVLALGPEAPGLSITWFTVTSGPALELALGLDASRWALALTVAAIALAVAIYSVGYLADEPAGGGIVRYFAVLSAFVAAMQAVVLSDNLLTLVLGWEGVGLASFFLIGHWHMQPVVGRAARLAIVVNRIGDAALLAALGLALSGAHLAAPELLAGALLTAAMAKSAQGPLALWLPEAMAGPTPVSALVHSATMVAAGIILLIKVEPWLTDGSRAIALVVGSLTALVAALSALQQTDIKRLLAQSTLSQLGYLLAAIGLEAGPAAELHLLTHAAFKSTLFLVAGVVIHAQAHAGAAHPQDLRIMGGLFRRLPLAALCWAIAAAGLAGLPLTAGALSKEGIIAAGDGRPLHAAAQAILLLTALLTAAYTTWASAAIWLGPTRSDAPTADTHAHTPSAWMQMPVVALALLTLAGSALWWGAHVDLVVFTLVTGATGLGIWRAWAAVRTLRAGRWATVPMPLRLPSDLLMLSYRRFIALPLQRGWHALAWVEMALIDSVIEAVAWVIAVPAARLADWLDRRAVDGLVSGLGNSVDAGGAGVRSLQSGRVQSYLLLSLLALVLVAGVAVALAWLRQRGA